MLDNCKRTKIKNNQIQCWRLELASYSYTIKYGPGKDNACADSLTRAFCNSTLLLNLVKIHAALCHPGITWLLHFVRTKNLLFSTDDVRKVCSNCRICAELKPSFYKPIRTQLIKAIKSFERISIDFKGPVSSTSPSKYLHAIIDKYFRFPFIFPCSNMNSSTVIACLNKLCSLCGMPQYIHSDNAKSLRGTVKDFLLKHGIASSKSSPYHPTGNEQVERYVCRIEIHTSSPQIQRLTRVLLGNRLAGGIALIAVSFKYYHKHYPASFVFQLYPALSLW